MKGTVRPALALLVLVGACREAATPPEPQSYTLVSTDVWSGTDAVLTSQGFAPDLPLPTVSLESTPLVVRRVDDSTLAARLPDLPGPHQLRVTSPYVLSVGMPIRLRGFARIGDGPDVQGRMQPLPGPPALLGQGATGLVRWDLALGSLTPFPDSMHDGTCVWGVGPSFDPRRVVLHTRQCLDYGGWTSWRVAPPTAMSNEPIGTNKFVAELAPGKWLEVHNHEFYLMACDSVACSSSLYVQADNTYDVIISPRGDRAVPLAYWRSDGAAIVDAPAAQISYRLGALGQLRAAAFSADGDTLFAAAIDTAQRAQLLAVRAVDGQVDTVIPLTGEPIALALDPVRPWLYLLKVDDFRTVVVEVRDRRTMAVLAAPAVPTGIDACPACWGTGTLVLPSPLDHLVYIVDTRFREYTPGAAPRRLMVFDTPP